MAYRIRHGRLDDQDHIAAFTRETFTWGDYVAGALPTWVADPNGLVVVAVADDDVPVAMSRATMLSPAEAWFQGARVHPDHRRRGLAGAMASSLESWAAQRGARVARLLVEEWNAPARAQVEHDGFRPVGDWGFAERAVGAASPLTGGNGGRRVPALEQLVRAHSAEAEPAFMSWSAGPLGRAGRGMLAVGWTMRRLTVADLEAAGRDGALWAARSGWVVATRDEESIDVGWLETREEDAPDLMRALVDLAMKRDAERLTAKLPAVRWLTTAARRAGCEVHGLVVYEKPLASSQ